MRESSGKKGKKKNDRPLTERREKVSVHQRREGLEFLGARKRAKSR